MSTYNKPSITPAENGPLIVNNLEHLIDNEGAFVETKKTIALCRCGQSENKPYCDGSHVKAGFTGERIGHPEDKKLVFESDPLTVYENIALCSRAGFCASGKPDAWRAAGLSEEKIMELVRKCPSGAFSYALSGKEAPDDQRPALIRIRDGGPYYVEGGIELSDAQWAEGSSKEHYALCSCGASKMKPFCDGTHAGE